MNFDKVCTTISVVVSAIIVLGTCWLMGAMKWMAGGLLQTAVAVVAMFVVWFILAAVIGALLAKCIRKNFIKENGEILENFSAKEDADKLYVALTTMKNPPRFQNDKAMMHLNISTALYFQGKNQEALEELEKVKTDNKQISEIAEKQKAEIIAKMTSK